MVPALLSSDDRKYLTYILYGAFGVSFLGFLVIYLTQTSETEYFPTYSSTSYKTPEWASYINIAIYIGVFALEPLFQKRKRGIIILLSLMLVFMLVRLIFWESIFEFLPMYFLSPLLFYSVVRGVYYKNVKLFVSGFVSGIIAIGIAFVLEWNSIHELLNLLSKILPFDINSQIEHHIAGYIVEFISIVAFFFFMWVFDKLLIQGKAEFLRIFQFKSPAKFQSNKDYTVLLIITYSIIFPVFYGLKGVISFHESFGFSMIYIIFYLPYFFLALPLLIFSKINIMLMLAKRRGPFFFHWLMLLPLVNIIVAIVGLVISSKEDKFDYVSIMRIKKNYGAFVTTFFILQILSMMFYLLMWSSSRPSNLSVVIIYNLLVLLAYLIVTLNRKGFLFILLGFTPIIITVIVALGGSFLYAFHTSLTPILVMIYMKNSLQPTDKEEITLYFIEGLKNKQPLESIIDKN